MQMNQLLSGVLIFRTVWLFFGGLDRTEAKIMTRFISSCAAGRSEVRAELQSRWNCLIFSVLFKDTEQLEPRLAA